MSRNIYYYILAISFLALACGQQETHSKKEDSDSKTATEKVVLKDIDTGSYDSVFYYGDVNGVSYKGMNKLGPGELSYPFTAFCYLKGNIEVRIYFSATELVKRYIKKYKEYAYTQIKSYSREFRDTVYGVTLFINDSVNIAFGGNKELMKGDSRIYFKHFAINSMNAGADLLRKKWYSHAYSEKNYSLEEVLDWIKKDSPINDFERRTEDVLELRGGDIYRIYHFENNRNLDEKHSSDDKVLQNRDVAGHSFFYFFNRLSFSDIPVL